MAKNLILIIMAVILGAISQMLLKAGTNECLPHIPGMGSFRDMAVSVFAFLTNFKIIFALFLYGSGFILWLFILTKFQLSYAFPLLASNYIIVMILSWLIFGENITSLRVLGTFLITIGVILIARGA